jgi:hypothetical protein
VVTLLWNCVQWSRQFELLLMVPGSLNFVIESRLEVRTTLPESTKGDNEMFYYKQALVLSESANIVGRIQRITFEASS